MEQPTNPFDPAVAPFAGRESALTQVIQYVNRSTRTQALVFLGQRHSGKTALLKQFSTLFDEPTIGLTINLKSDVDEPFLLLLLYQLAHAALIESGISEERLPELPTHVENWRGWLSDDIMPRLLPAMRGGRRLFYLIDNGEILIQALESGRLPADLPAYLQTLLHPQLGFVLCVDTEVEDRLSLLSPLIDPTEAPRLHFLSLEEITSLFPGPDNKAVKEVTEAIYHATGGHPALVQQFGYHLWARTGSRVMTYDDVLAVTPLVYTAAEPIYRALWQELIRNERLTLTALVSLHYDDPLKAITAERIEGWLVETDFRIDLTAINAAIRGLEYREMLVSERGTLVLLAELFRKWLLDNARLESITRPERPRDLAAPLPDVQSHRPLWIAITAAVILFVLLVLFLAFNAPRFSDSSDPVPTVTLAPQN